METLQKIFGSSTWWVGIITAIVGWLNAKYSLGIPPELLVTAAGGYAIKEAAGKVNTTPKPPTPVS